MARSIVPPGIDASATQPIGLARCPGQAAFDDRPRLGDVEVLCDMAHGGVEHAPGSPMARPDYGHRGAGDPGRVDARERRRRQDIVAWVDVHVVLHGAHAEVRQPRCDRVVMIDDVHVVVNDVVRVRHLLTAHHELVGDVVAERVGHSAVPTRETNARFDGREQPAFLLRRERPIVRV